MTDNLPEFIRLNKKTLEEDQSLLTETFLKIIPQTKMIKELYTYEMINFIPKEEHKVNNLDDLIKLMLFEMKLYQGIVGGFNLEDTEWRNCKTSKRFEVNNNQQAYYNSIEQHNCADKEFIKFMNNFIKHIRKFIYDPLKLSIDYKIYDDDYNELSWIILACEERCSCKH